MAYNLYLESPYSSYGNGGSTDGTPSTNFTAYSPDDVRLSRPSPILKSAGPPLKEGQHDPFVIALPKADLKLSATALSFQPNLVPSKTPLSLVTPRDASESVPIPGSAQYLSKQIAEHTPPPRAPESIEVQRHGTFTTDTGTSRSIKVSGTYGSLVMPAVQASLEVSSYSLTF
jgi:hypothetical protein